MDNLQGKKLLIMGANPETVPLVEMANEMGIKTLVTSNRPDDAAKKVAWKQSITKPIPKRNRQGP